MTAVPRSLRGRLLALSLLATLAALAFAAVAIGGILERFVTAGLDDRLDGQIAALAGAVRADGTVDPRRAALVPPYADPASGWWWSIEAPRGRLASSAARAPAPSPPLPEGEEEFGRHHHPPPDPDGGDRPRPFEWRDGAGGSRHGRRLVVRTAAGPAIIVATAPRALVERPIRAAMVPLAGSLGVLGIALGIASLVQLRVGLRPLTALGRAVAAVRAGERSRLPDDQPSELAPLVRELNALVDQDAARLAQARGHVANLAHGLKTPLATLSLALREPGRDPDGRLGAEVARMDAAIRHHLGRARADTAAGQPRAAVPLAPAIAALGDALARIHADRGIAFAAQVADDLSVAVDRQDLDELLGNLLDNGWRWARSRLLVAAARDGAAVVVTIADDGPGIPAAALADALAAGRRLDETGEGYGFGLAIARELIELHGGTLLLGETPGGGLSSTVRLPRALPAG